MPSVLDSYAQGAAERLGGRTVCSLTTIDSGSLFQVASNDPRAAACDQLETREGAGPCITAMARLYSVLIEDVDTATQWPNWRRAALDNGFRSFVALPAYVHDDLTVGVNVYSEDPYMWTAAELVAVDAYVQELADAMRNA